MYKPWRMLAIVALLSLLQACSQLQYLVQDDVEQVNTLLAQQDFYPALDLIDRAPTDHPQYQQLTTMRSQVLDEIAAFEKATLQQTQQLINQGNWAQSLQTLDQGLQKIPASKALLAKRQRVEKHIENKLTDLKLSLAKARASTIADELAIIQTIVRYTGEEQTLQTRQHAATSDRKILVNAARRHIQQQQWTQAKNLAQKAQAIKDDSQIRELLSQIEQHITNTEVSRLQQAIDNNELLTAKQLAAELANEQQPEVQQLINTLNQKVDLLVLDLTRSGQQAYTNGNIDKAIDYWQQAVELHPQDTELVKRLERARSFQENYRRLKGQ